MHSQPMSETEGEFTGDEQCPDTKCRKCGQTGGVTCKPWESSCGGYTDYKYTCATCGGVWWIDGPDA